MPPDGPAPADFASFVAAHEQRLRLACHELTGQGQLGDRVAVDLLATVALGWRLRPRRRRHQAGAARLDRLLRREARSWRRPAEPQKRPGRIRVLVDVPVPMSGFADRAWIRARAMRRGRALAGLGVVALLAFIAVVGPRPPQLISPPDPGPIVAPAGVKVLPPFAQLASLAHRQTRLPPTIDAAPRSTVDLVQRPVRRALAVLRFVGGPLIVVADDAIIRTMGDRRLVDSQLLATSLSPDGERVALLGSGGLLVVDLTSATIRFVMAQVSGPSLSWRDSRTVLLSIGASSAEVNVDTAAVTVLDGVRGADVVTARGPADRRLVELMSATVSLPPRIRRWQGGNFEDRPIFGPSWIANWNGAGWSTLDLLVRPCSSGEIGLPRGEAQAALGAVTATGLYEATLVATDSTALDVIGFADTGTILVGAYSPTNSYILAWSPAGRSVQLVTAVNRNVRLSVADLLPAGP